MNVTGRHQLAALASLSVVAALGSSACDKKEEASTVAPSASALAPSVVEGMKALKYTVDPAGKSAIDMPAPVEHIKADTSAAAGTLEIDPLNLANSRGEVKIDLTTLKTHTFDSDSQNAAQTGHAQTWLEVGDKAPADQREANRWVVFAIRSFGGLSVGDLTKVAPTKDAAGDVRDVTLTAHGDFLLHGHKVPKDVALDVKFHYPPGAPATGAPTSVDVVTTAPMHVVLAEHDVKPRDEGGKLKQAAFGLLGTKVAETADVSLDLHATPAP
jgi:polyisoprenoid-binding protein YceI